MINPIKKIRRPNISVSKLNLEIKRGVRKNRIIPTPIMMNAARLYLLNLFNLATLLLLVS